jgi:hypothetical protein
MLRTGASEVVTQHPGHPRGRAGRRPRFAEVRPLLPCPTSTTEEREEVRHNPAESLLEGLHALELARQQGFYLRGEVHNPPLVVLRRAGVQTQRAGREVESSAI